MFFLCSVRSPHRTAKPSRGCLPLAHPRALPAVVDSDRRSPSAMCEFPFECWGCAFGFWSGRALATGTAWAGLCLIHHHWALGKVSVCSWSRFEGPDPRDRRSSGRWCRHRETDDARGHKRTQGNTTHNTTDKPLHSTPIGPWPAAAGAARSCNAMWCGVARLYFSRPMISLLGCVMAPFLLNQPGTPEQAAQKTNHPGNAEVDGRGRRARAGRGGRVPGNLRRPRAAAASRPQPRAAAVVPAPSERAGARGRLGGSAGQWSPSARDRSEVVDLQMTWRMRTGRLNHKSNWPRRSEVVDLGAVLRRRKLDVHRRLDELVVVREREELVKQIPVISPTTPPRPTARESMRATSGSGDLFLAPTARRAAAAVPCSFSSSDARREEHPSRAAPCPSLALKRAARRQRTNHTSLVPPRHTNTHIGVAHTLYNSDRRAPTLDDGSDRRAPASLGLTTRNASGLTTRNASPRAGSTTTTTQRCRPCGWHYSHGSRVWRKTNKQTNK